MRQPTKNITHFPDGVHIAPYVPGTMYATDHNHEQYGTQ